MTLASTIIREIKATLCQDKEAVADSVPGDPLTNIAEFYALAPVGYFTLSPEGLIEDVNPTGIRLLRAKREQVLKRPFTEFIAKKHRQRFNQQLKVRADGPHSHRFDLRLKRSTGKFCDAQVETRGLVDNHQKKVTKWLMAVTDVSATKRAKDNVRRGKKIPRQGIGIAHPPFFRH